ncbi:MAG: hypothetical protein O3B90_03220, partial [Actinomycetota bacterium]|nr:hypothetical protein [Actinomycetota bacterium]
AHVVWEVFEESGTRAPLGLVVAVSDTTVAAWQLFELSYSTDGSVGGVTSRSSTLGIHGDVHSRTERRPPTFPPARTNWRSASLVSATSRSSPPTEAVIQ